MSAITSDRNLTKLVPHPILDDSSKMMRLIANPVYDRLTLSRAANVRRYTPTNHNQQASQMQRAKEIAELSSFKSQDVEDITTTRLFHPTEPGGNRSRSKSIPSIEFLLSKDLPPVPVPNQKPSRSTTPASRSRVSTARSRASTTRSTIVRPRAKSARLSLQSVQAELVANTAKIRNPIPPGTTRFVNSRHGFEVQYYASRNWLSTDVYTKETCPEHEKTFRDMLEQKRLFEQYSRNIYSSEYYANRLSELLQSYKQGLLSHAEWAEQSYQIHMLKILYAQALKREQREKINRNTDNDSESQAPTQNPSNESKEIKIEENTEQHLNRLNTPFSHNLTDEGSFLSNNSLGIPVSYATDEANTPLPHRVRVLSMSTNDDVELQRLAMSHRDVSPKPKRLVQSAAMKSKALSLLDGQRWSLHAMVKRVVGLSDQLPSSAMLTDGKQTPMININTDSDIK
ncbi:unnamed protein product [Adineta steineri]|uniref:Uncharacterized protein n=1 Tax=Adineta steineri TaxID=433720 RepID=A0A818MVX7_9BILA|nr:unnamed protein product [Adineta steineri]CAF3596266.1 unnamed protein product [Adineta steineri]